MAIQGDQKMNRTVCLALILVIAAVAVPVLGRGAMFEPQEDFGAADTTSASSTDPEPVTSNVFRHAFPVDNQWSNPKALRVLSRVEEGVSATEWAISGELENHTSTKSHGNAAVSGVSKKIHAAKRIRRSLPIDRLHRSILDRRWGDGRCRNQP